MGFNTLPLEVESVSAVTASNSVSLGTRVYNNSREYVYVYNGGNSQISKGQACVVSAASGYTVTVSGVVDPFCKPFGVVANATLTTGTYGWVCTRGFVDLKAGADNTITAGAPIIAGADGAIIQATGATGTTGIVASFGKAMTTTASAGTFGAYVNCL